MPTKYVLAGDIGGTKTRLAIYALVGGKRVTPVREATYPSRKRHGLEEVVEDFLAAGREKIHGAAFGVAGPVIDGQVKT
ncbi:MAG: glucokinase, partial [Candidatus Binatia bacterium]